MTRTIPRLALLLVLCAALPAAGCTGRDTPDPVEPQRPTGRTVLTISAVGDIMMHSPQLTVGKRPDGTYDFKHCFEDIRPRIEDADIAMCNLEVTISNPDRGYGGYPLFRAPEAILGALKYTGFDVVTTANNHSYDGGEFGVVNTLDRLDEYRLLHTGGARTQQERDRVLIITRNDIRVAVLAYTYGTNGMEAAIDESKRTYMVNLIDEDVIARDAARARASGADIVIACLHWGVEYTRQPGAEQTALADRLFRAGIDVIFGSHPHVLQPMDRKRVVRDDGSLADVFVIYSLGNFISNQTKRYTDSGVIVNLEIVRDYDAGTVTIGEVSYVPTWVYRHHGQGRLNYRVLAAGTVPDAGLTAAAERRMNEVWLETTSLLGTDRFRAIR